MIENSLADKLTAIAVKQLATGVQFRQPRMTEIAKAVDLYNNKTKPALRGRFNVPIPMMGGFVDTLMSKIDDPPKVNFSPTEEADLLKAKKVQSAWEIDSSKGKWAMKDRAIKKLAIFSGRGTAKIFSESLPAYQNHFEIVDYMDFVAEPQGGGDLENHLFLGQENIFRTWSELKAGAKSGLYDAGQVRKLQSVSNDADSKRNEEIFQNKKDRYGALGLDVDTNNYVGQNLYNLTEWGMVWNGERYYLLFDYSTGIWIRAERLKDIFKSNLWPWISFATHEDPFNFWSKAPTDDMRPVCDAIHTIFNQILENINKRNWHQRAYDPEVFPNPSQLRFTPEGLAQAVPKPGKSIADGIYTFETPEIASSVNLIGFVNSFMGEKTAITPSSQGVSEKDKRVGIYYGDLQQVADRLGLYSKSYKDFYAQAGVRYYHGLKEHMTQPLMVKMIGEKGIEWDWLKKEDLTPSKDFDIDVTGGRAEAEADELKRKSKAESLGFAYKFPELRQRLNHDWGLEEILRGGGYEDDQIRIARDVQMGGDREMMAMAAEENQRMYKGDKIPPNRKAITSHLQKHLDFSDNISNEIERTEGKEKLKKQDIWANIMNHFKAEIPFAQQNMFRKANELIMRAGIGELGMAGPKPTTPPVSPMEVPEERPEVNVPPTIAGTQRRSQRIARGLRPNE